MHGSEFSFLSPGNGHLASYFCHKQLVQARYNKLPDFCKLVYTKFQLMYKVVKSVLNILGLL